MSIKTRVNNLEKRLNINTSCKHPIITEVFDDGKATYTCHLDMEKKFDSLEELKNYFNIKSGALIISYSL